MPDGSWSDRSGLLSLNCNRLGGASSLEETNTSKGLAKIRCGAEQEGSKAELLGCHNVRILVVDERDCGWIQAMLLNKKIEELRVRLAQANSAGDEDSREAV